MEFEVVQGNIAEQEADALVGRAGDTQMPDPDFRLERGDHLTFIGRKEPVRDAIERCHPDPGSL